MRPEASGAGLWPARSFTAEDVLALKGTQQVTVVIPAKDEAQTVAGVVGAIRDAHAPGLGSGLVDELLVVDDGSVGRHRPRGPGGRGEGSPDPPLGGQGPGDDRGGTGRHR